MKRGESTTTALLRRAPGWFDRRYLLIVVIGLVAALLITLPNDRRPKSHAAPPTSLATTGAGTVGPLAGPSASAARLPQATVTLTSASGGVRIPRSFFGLSAEYPELAIYERHLALFERVLSLITRDGPLVLRIGGDTADQTYWNAPRSVIRRGAFNLTQKYLTRTSRLVRDLRMRLFLDMNLVSGSPPMAASVAKAAVATMPRRSILGFEIGNEPDLYHWRKWPALLPVVRGVLRDRDPLKHFSAATYAEEFPAYARTLARVSRPIPVAGPAIANPDIGFNWLSLLRAKNPRQLGMATAHRYPLSACVGPRSSKYPTVARVLSESASAGPAEDLGAAVRLARAVGIPLRLTEVNSVTCGGLRGVSDTFATALWAPDALFEFMRVGVQGVHLHIRAGTINGPFRFQGNQLHPRPLLYGLMMFARTLGPGTRLMPLHLHAQRSLHVKAWAVRTGGMLRFLVINKGPRRAGVTVDTPGTGAATVERLLGPSAAARSGVTLGGQQLGPSGAWVGRPKHETLARSHGRYRLRLPGVSAALLSIRVR